MVVMVEGILNRPMGISVFSHRRQKCKFAVFLYALMNL